MSDPTRSTNYAIVTGGGSGLGRAFCLHLAHDGWSVAIVDVDQVQADETLRLIEQAGGSGRVELCDVTEPAAWRLLRERLQTDWPRLDLLINNAGMFGSGYIGRLDLAAAERLIKLNLLGVLYGCEVIVPWLIACKRTQNTQPYVINIASVFAHFCPPGMGVYSASKAGVIALSETLYNELRPQGVGVTVVCSGVMPTQFADRATFDDEAYQSLTEKYVRHSRLAPEIVAEAALCAMRRGDLYVVEGRSERWYWRLKRFVPTTFLRRVARRVRNDLKHHQF